jgi:hypothetical protein
MVKQSKMTAGKVDAPAGTAEAFRKYLELKPQGPLADMAQENLKFLATNVETNFKAHPKNAKK